MYVFFLLKSCYDNQFGTLFNNCMEKTFAGWGEEKGGGRGLTGLVWAQDL
jgi:hypothetical protein